MTKIVIAIFALSMICAVAIAVVWDAWLRLTVEIAQVRERLRQLARRCDVVQDTLERQHAARMEATRSIANLRHLEVWPASNEAASGVETP